VERRVLEKSFWVFKLLREKDDMFEAAPPEILYYGTYQDLFTPVMRLATNFVLLA
jgi:hypothetical protein